MDLNGGGYKERHTISSRGPLNIYHWPRRHQPAQKENKMQAVPEDAKIGGVDGDLLLNGVPQFYFRE